MRFFCLVMMAMIAFLNTGNLKAGDGLNITGSKKPVVQIDYEKQMETAKALTENAQKLQRHLEERSKELDQRQAKLDEQTKQATTVRHGCGHDVSYLPYRFRAKFATWAGECSCPDCPKMETRPFAEKLVERVAVKPDAILYLPMPTGYCGPCKAFEGKMQEIAQTTGINVYKVEGAEQHKRLLAIYKNLTGNEPAYPMFLAIRVSDGFGGKEAFIDWLDGKEAD